MLGIKTYDAATGQWVTQSFPITVDLANQTATIAISHLSTFVLGVVPATTIAGFPEIFLLFGTITTAAILVLSTRKRILCNV